MRDVNELRIKGRVAQEPQEFHTNSGARGVRVKIATNRYFRRQGQEESEKRATFHPVVAWAERGDELLALKVGQNVQIEGRMEYNEGERDGVRVTYPNVIAQEITPLAAPLKRTRSAPPPEDAN